MSSPPDLATTLQRKAAVHSTALAPPLMTSGGGVVRLLLARDSSLSDRSPEKTGAHVGSGHPESQLRQQ